MINEKARIFPEGRQRVAGGRRLQKTLRVAKGKQQLFHALVQLGIVGARDIEIDCSLFPGGSLECLGEYLIDA